MGDSFITIIAIFLAAILMFVFPLLAMSERTDDISQLSIESTTTDFVDNVRNTGTLTLDNYDKFVQQIGATGNSYAIEMEAHLLDENPGVKTTQAETTKIGENVYLNLYTSQIEKQLGILDKGESPSDYKGRYAMYFKEGDLFSTTVKNTNTTIAQSLKGFLYKIAGNDTYSIAAQHAGMVTVNGTTR